MLDKPAMSIRMHWELMATQDCYRTSATRRINILDRMFWWSNTWFYMRLIEVVTRAGLKTWFLGYNQKRWATDSLRILALSENCGTTVTVEGLQNLRNLSQPVVVVANHMGMLEPLFAAGIIIPQGVNLNTVLKDSLLRYPFFGAVIAALDTITVGRKDPREDLVRVLKKGAESLAAGRSVLIFPQSTRSPEFIPSEFNTLGIKLARNAGVKIVPMALRTDFLGVGTVVRDFGPIHRDRPIHFRIGPPMTVEGNGKRAHEQILAFITDCLREWNVPIRNESNTGNNKPTEDKGAQI
jgi:1-acyl-sn-glycerol-3-phosphate acyltransferase